jgi:NAD(P)-dependent dehydrogenase (short-subunit alcohol dehydrogenase family)
MLSLSKIRDRDEEGPGEPPPSTTTKTINALMNNAISGATERTLTVDGIERIFQSTYLGHFLLTARLFEEGLLSGSGCTVINVSSVAHRAAEVKWNEDDETQNAKNEYGFNFDNINSDIGYSFQTYNQAKLANIMFTKELQRRADLATALSHEKSYLTSVSLEPGGVATDIWRTSLGFDPRTFEQRRANGEEIDQPADQTWKDKLTSSFFYRAWTQVERGANAQVWLAYASSNGSDIDLIGGQHYSEYRKPIPALGFAYQQHSNQKLWEVSEALADIRFDLETSAHRQPQNKCPADAA